MSCRNLAKLVIKKELCDTTKACLQARPSEKGYHLTEKKIVNEVRKVVTAPAIRMIRRSVYKFHGRLPGSSAVHTGGKECE